MANTHWFEVELNEGVVEQHFLTSLGAKRYCSKTFSDDVSVVYSINFVKKSVDGTLIKQRLYYPQSAFGGIGAKWVRAV